MNKISLPKSALKVIEQLQKNHFEAWAVGGSVRDLLAGKITKAWDFTTNATPDEIQNIFKESFYDNQFGTVGIALKHLREQFPEIGDIDDKEIYEITTYRNESGYADNRHPDVVGWGKTIEDDLKRRDFTINSIAVSCRVEPCAGLNPDLAGLERKIVDWKIMDLFDGQKDIRDKIIRAVGDPNERFSEDALRMMRAVRFASELGFTIEEKTLKAITDNVYLIKNISWERIRDELLKILASDFPYEGMMFLKQTGLLKKILPEIEDCFIIPQKSPGRHHIYDVGTHCMLSLKNCPSKDAIVRLATLLHDVVKAKTYKTLATGTITFYNHEVVGARMIKNISDRLRLSNEQRNSLWILTRWHQFTVDEHQTDSAIRRFIKRVGVEKIKDMIDLRTGDRLGGGLQTATSWRLQLYMKRIIDVQKHTPSVKDLKVNGNDVMKVLDIKPGPTVGIILDKLFCEITGDPSKNEREYLLERIGKINRLPK